jgi:hypothetical protein
MDAKRTAKQPFFACIPTNAAHGPHVVPEEYYKQYRSKPGVKDDTAKFFGMVENIDTNFGKLRKKLDEWGIAGNTLVIFFTGDNGGTAGDDVHAMGQSTRSPESHEQSYLSKECPGFPALPRSRTRRHVHSRSADFSQTGIHHGAASHLSGGDGKSAKVIGEITAFPIPLHRFDERANLLIQGKCEYKANVSDSPAGTIASVEHALESMEERLRERESDLRQCHKQSEDLAKQLDHPFEHEEKLETAAKRQQEIVEALDITQDQASAKLDAVAEEMTAFVEEARQQTVHPKRAKSASVAV